MKEENPLVSIIVITYNSAKYVLETLESTKAQSYKNIELIVSDDCSTDDTVYLIKNWISLNKDFFQNTKIIESPNNTGVPSNLNRALAVASGIWIRLLAGDDLLKEDCIENSLNKIRNLPISCRVFRTSHPNFIENKGKNEIKDKIPVDSVFYDPRINSNQQLTLALRNINPSMSTFFIKKEVFLEVGGFDERFPLFEDRPFLIKILTYGNKIYCDNMVTGYHRVRNNSIFNSDRFEKIITDWMIYSYIPVFKTYFYPHLNDFEKIFHRFNLFTAKILYHSKLNNRNYITLVIYKILNLPYTLFRYFNRCYYIRKIKKELEKS